MSNKDSYSEIVALLKRNEGEGGNRQDVDEDMRRLLLMSRDARQRDEMIQVHATRRITNILKKSAAISTQKFCASILGNLALSEKGRRSASSCNRWDCVSHRHQCPLFLLLFHAQSHRDEQMRHICAAALLTFSSQTECQLHIDTISGIQPLLKMIDARDGDLNVYAAGTIWNMCKSPIIVLKLETTHGILIESLARKLTNVLWTPLEPFHLAVKQTGERGTTGILFSDGLNANILLVASISSQLSIVLHVENYSGPIRSLRETIALQVVDEKHEPKGKESKSVAHYDESGILASRTCAICMKPCRIKKRMGKYANSFVVCAKDGCGQTYHLKCSRWRQLISLEETETAKDTSSVSLDQNKFYCNDCVLDVPLYYADFAAWHPQNTKLLSELQFQAVRMERVIEIEDPESNHSHQPQQQTYNERSKASSSTGIFISRRTSSIKRRSSSITTTSSSSTVSAIATKKMGTIQCMVFNRKHQVVGIATKFFRIPSSSKDDEIFFIHIDYLLYDSYPMTHQKMKSSLIKTHNNKAIEPLVDLCIPTWEISFVSEDARQNPFLVGNMVLWPGPFLEDFEEDNYLQDKQLQDLENAYIYEFIGKDQKNMRYSFGANPNINSSIIQQLENMPSQISTTSSTQAESTSSSSSSRRPSLFKNEKRITSMISTRSMGRKSTTTQVSGLSIGLWTNIYERKGICMKTLTEEIGKKRQALLHKASIVVITSSASIDSRNNTPASPTTKPHFVRTLQKM